MISLDFEQRAKSHPIEKSIFSNLLKRGFELLLKQPHLRSLLKKIQHGVIHLVMVDDKEISVLNKDYRGKNQPTDVLSFSYFEEERFPGEDLLGEIVISVQTAKQQAQEHNKTLRQELQFLFVHGLLHIFGYDHEKASERKIMFDLQDEILGTKSWREIIDNF